MNNNNQRSAKVQPANITLYRGLLLAIFWYGFVSPFARSQSSNVETDLVFNLFDSKEQQELNRSFDQLSEAADQFELTNSSAATLYEIEEDVLYGVSKRARKQSLQRLEEVSHELRGQKLTAFEMSNTAYKRIFRIYDFQLIMLQVENPEHKEALLALRHEAARVADLADEAAIALRHNDNYRKLSTAIDEALALRRKSTDLLMQAFCLVLDCQGENPEQEDEAAYSEVVFVLNPDSIFLDEELPFLADADEGAGNVVEPEDEPSVQRGNKNELAFLIQIVAVSNPLTKRQVSELYSGPHHVEKYYESGLYKYRVGPFDSYAQALAAQKTIQRDTFIVAFKGDRRINLEEAMSLQ